MRWRLRSWAAAIALSAGAGAALADYTDGVIRIGVLNDRAFRPLAESDCPLIKK